MAIAIELAEYNGLGRAPGQLAPVVEMPALKVRRLAAAGNFVLTANAKLFIVKNTGDPIYAKVVPIADAAAPTGSDNLSNLIGTGDRHEFCLPHGVDPATQKFVFVAA